MKQLVFFVATIFAVITACSGLTNNHLPLEDIEEIRSGLHSNYPGENGVEKVIASDFEFKTEWEKTFSSNSQPPEVPVVDFEKRVVVLLMLDHKPTGGYGIDDINLSYNQAEVVVRYSEVEPGPYCGTYQATTRPYVFISIPKLDGEITIIKEKIITTDCSN